MRASVRPLLWWGLDELPIGKFYGIGKVTEKRLLDRGIYTGLDLRKLSREELAALLGKAGHFYYDMARGVDNRPVGVKGTRKSLGRSRTQAHEMITGCDSIGVFEEIICLFS